MPSVGAGPCHKWQQENWSSNKLSRARGRALLRVAPVVPSPQAIRFCACSKSCGGYHSLCPASDLLLMAVLWCAVKLWRTAERQKAEELRRQQVLAQARKEIEAVPEVRSSLGLAGTVRATLAEMAKALVDSREGEQEALPVLRSRACSCFPRKCQGASIRSFVIRLMEEQVLLALATRAKQDPACQVHWGAHQGFSVQEDAH